MRRQRRSRTGPKSSGKSARKNSKRYIEWIEAVCRVPEGRDVGKPLVLRKWQRKVIADIYDNPYGTRRAIVSFGRKNGKTALAAVLLLLHLCGPAHRVNSQLFSAAQSRDQAAILFTLAAKMVRLSPDLSAHIVIRDTAKQIYFPEAGTLYRALSADATTAYGLSPVFIVHDELGQVRGPKSELYEALETATAAQENPLSIVISTQAPADADLLSILIDDAKAGNDPRTVLSLHTADASVDPFSESAIKQANPAYGDFQNAAEVLAMANDAKRMPSREAEYRNLILNQRVEAHSPFVSQSVWQANTGDPPKDLDGEEIYCGLDLSATNDLTALVSISKHGGVWQVVPVFWIPENGIEERGRRDRVPYSLWKNQGYLQTTPGSSVEYEFVAQYLRWLFDRCSVRGVAFDRWNWKHFRPWLERAGFSESELKRFIEFGQGFQSMSPALRDFESLLLEKKLAHGGHPVLQMCAANAVVRSDPAGNRKLDKAKSNGRIDGMVALAMAVAAAEISKPEPVSVYETRGIRLL